MTCLPALRLHTQIQPPPAKLKVPLLDRLVKATTEDYPMRGEGALFKYGMKIASRFLRSCTA